MFCGLLIALFHWIIYWEEEKELIDIKSLLILFAVVISGLLSATCRILLSPENSFLANMFGERIFTLLAGVLSCSLEEIHYWLFISHITIAAGFVAYVPFSKLIHIFAAPIGRSITLDKEYVEKKRTKITESLL